MNLVSNSSFCLDLELEFELGVDNWVKIKYLDTSLTFQLLDQPAVTEF